MYAIRSYYGIDLGTTNSVLAYSALNEESPNVQLLNIPQLVAANTIDERSSLPSFLHLGMSSDAESGTWNVPWENARTFAVGEVARRQSADLPQRTISAAKSWFV